VEIPLHGTPAGSRIIALDDRSKFVKEWKAPVGVTSIRMNISSFAKGMFCFARPVRDGGTYRIEEFFYQKRENPRYRMDMRASALRGRYYIDINSYDLLPERRQKRPNLTGLLLPIKESIVSPCSETPRLLTPLNRLFNPGARAALTWLAVALFGFMTYSPVALASQEGRETTEERQRTAPNHRPMAPMAITEDEEDDYEWRWLAAITEESGMPAIYDNYKWTYKKNDLPITNSSGGDTTYTITYGGDDYLCGVYADTAVVLYSSNVYVTSYRYVNEPHDSLVSWDPTARFEGDSVETGDEWVYVVCDYYVYPDFFYIGNEENTYFQQYADGSVKNNAGTGITLSDIPDVAKSYVVDNTVYYFSISLNYIEVDTTAVFFLNLGRGEVSVSSDSARIAITNISGDSLDLGLSIDSVQYFTLLDSFYDPALDSLHAYCYGCYSVMAIFADSLFSPTADSFSAGDFVTYDTTFADSAIFGPRGFNIPPDSSVYLWFRFDAPEAYPLDSLAVPVKLHIREAE